MTRSYSLFACVFGLLSFTGNAMAAASSSDDNDLRSVQLLVSDINNEFILAQMMKKNEFTATDGVAGATHYGDPADGCMADEQGFTIMGIEGKVCCPTCTSSPCPTDVPDGVTAVPTCALSNAATGDKYCVLICAPGDEEEDDTTIGSKENNNMLRASSNDSKNSSVEGTAGMCGAATCRPVQTTGVCTYDTLK